MDRVTATVLRGWVQSAPMATGHQYVLPESANHFVLQTKKSVAAVAAP